MEFNPQISPDGRWLAYTSTESIGEALKGEIYLRPFPEVDKGKWLISISGGHSPLWAHNGRELFYRNGDATMVVAVETNPTFKPGKPQTLFRGKYFSYIPGIELTPWDISPDGKRFVMTTLLQSADGKSEEKRQRKINIVLNWTEELKQRVPTK
jgi:Tol biopolymer transport system component